MSKVSVGRKIVIAAITSSTFVTTGLVMSPSAVAKVHATHESKNRDPVIYDSTVSPLPGSLESTAFEATETSEYGNQITFGGTARVLDNVVVTMDSFACQSGGSFTVACSTTPGATFSEPITLNLYNVGANNSVGSLVATDRQTFNIPYQPSADPNYASDCSAQAAQSGLSISNFAGSWFDTNIDPVTGLPIGCLVGYAANVTFNFGHVTVPNSIVYGIAYNTSDFGFQPWGDNTPCHSSSGGCGYDGLNVANSVSPPEPTVGSDPNLGTAYLDTENGPFYCDSGAGGTGTFRIDGRPDTQNCTGTGAAFNVGYSYSLAQGLCPGQITGGNFNSDPVSTPGLITGTPPCTVSPYIVPAVQFNAVTSPHAVITSANNASVTAGVPFSFTVNTTGFPIPRLTEVHKLPLGLTFTDNADGTATIAGTALTSDRNKVYRVILRANNLPAGGRNRQTFTLTLTGGRSR